MQTQVAGGSPVPRTAAARLGEVFVGREDELRAVLSCLEQPGGCRGVLLQGEAGVGKSRLLAEALGRDGDRHRCLRGRADSLQRERAFGAIGTAIEPRPGAGDAEAALAELLAATSTARVTGPWERGRILDGFVAVVHERCRREPVVLVVEDLQWADPGTLAVLGELLGPESPHGLTVLATLRSGARSRPLDHFLDRVVPDAVRPLVLGGLPDAAVGALLAATIGDRRSTALDRYVGRAGGNPLFVLELLRALLEQGALTTTPAADGPVVDVVGASLPPPLRLTILQRLSALSTASTEPLRVAALLGTTFSVVDLALVLGIPTLEALQRLDEPLRAGWLEDAGPRLAFRHDLVREALVSDQPEAARRAWHRHIARRLLAGGRDVAEVATHLVQGATAPDPEAASQLEEAGRRALAREPATAASLLATALRLAPEPTVRDHLALALGVALLWAGRYEDGEQVLGELLARPHAVDVDVEAALTLARTLILSGRTARALELLDEQLSRGPRPGERAQLEASRALACLLRGELEAAAASAALVLDGDVRPDDETRCLATWIDASLAAVRGHTHEGIDRARRAVELVRSSPDREAGRIPPQLALGSMLIDADRFAEGRRELALAARVSEDLGTLWHLPVQQVFSARGRYLAGELDDAAVEAETALALADEHRVAVLSVWAHAIVALVRLHRLDHAGARAALEAGDVVVALHGAQVRGMDWLLWARARLAAAEGATEAACELLAAVWDAERALEVRSERRLLGPDLVRWHLTLGERAAAREVADDVTRAARLMRTRSAEAAALHCRGLVDDAPDLLSAAAATTRDTPCLLAHVEHCVDAGERLATDERDAAIPLLQEAHRHAADLGMHAQRRRAEGLLRGLGVRRGVRGPRSRPARGWAALTPTERTVARLAAGGLTNPEIGERLFISRRTVQTHLSHTYAKLGIGSRVELAAEVARGG
jgi:DNA-binding CsgD family transcriptional regulator/tetratricopeptide (TPR) repeat protein